MKTIPSHRSLSIETRNTLVVHRINKGATSKDLEQEFNRTIQALLRTLREQHYSNTEAGKRAYNNIRAKLSENDKNSVLVAKQQVTKNSKVPVATAKQQITKNGRTLVPTTKKQISKPQKASKSKTVYLIETGTLLSMPIDNMLALNEGKAIFYLPRFCIDELAKISQKDERAKDILNMIYSDELFNKRIFPLSRSHSEPISVSKTQHMNNCKQRSMNLVNSAVNFALDSDNTTMVKVITSSREVTNILREVIDAENLSNVLQFAFVSSRNK